MKKSILSILKKSFINLSLFTLVPVTLFFSCSKDESLNATDEELVNQSFIENSDNESYNLSTLKSSKSQNKTFNCTKAPKMTPSNRSTVVSITTDVIADEYEWTLTNSTRGNTGSFISRSNAGSPGIKRKKTKERIVTVFSPVQYGPRPAFQPIWPEGLRMSLRVRKGNCWSKKGYITLKSY